MFPTVRSLDPSLLFQLFLAEFLKSYTTAQEVEAIYNGSSLSREPPAISKKRRELLLSLCTDLSGEVMSIAPTFPWTTRQGSLKALVHYCHLLRMPPLVERSERAYRQAVLARQHLLSWQERGHITPVHLRALARAVESLARNMHKIGQALTRELLQYAHDENIIFFLLRRQVEFDTLFHAPYVAGLLEKMYRGGIDQAEQHLIRQYTKRGFEHLLPTLTQTFADVRANA